MQRQEMLPNVVIYNALISTCDKGQAPDHQAIQRQGMLHNVITYSALISACAKTKQPERALRKKPFL